MTVCWSELTILQTLEIDLDSTENGVLLDVIAKLLYALTWNRNIK